MNDSFCSYIKDKFEDAKTARRFKENEWLTYYGNYKGTNSAKLRESEKSEVFIKLTKTKVSTGYDSMVDILFSQKKFPIVVEASNEPEGSLDKVSVPNDMRKQSFAKLGLDLGATKEEVLAKVAEKYGPIKEQLVSGPAVFPDEIQLSPAKEAALKMEKIIFDQLSETEGVKQTKKALFEAALFGTGIIKGPFNYKKTIHKFSKSKEYEATTKVIPRISHVSLWDFYPDPGATSIEDCGYVVQRHRLTEEKLSQLPTVSKVFSSKKVREVIGYGPNYVAEHFENIIYSDETHDDVEDNRFELLEFWGILSKEALKEHGITSKNAYNYIYAYSCGNTLLGFEVNPFKPSRMPYHVFPYEVDPYSIWGIGIGENVKDSQLLVNGHYRMAIDNLAYAGNVILEIDEQQLVPGQNLDLYPGKVFRRRSGMPGTAINDIKITNTAPSNLQMFETARRIADEETGIPSVMHGQTGVSGTGRTAAGLSMIMQAGGSNIKGAIKNVDEYLLKPLGESYFFWNMQFNKKDLPEIEGDLEIKPKGTVAVIQKEIRGQKLMQMLQLSMNPMLMPFTNIQNMLKEIYRSLDLDPEDFVYDLEQAKIVAEILKGLNNGQQGTSQASPTGQEQGNMGADPNMAGAPPDQSVPAVDGRAAEPRPVQNPGESGFTGQPLQA